MGTTPETSNKTAGTVDTVINVSTEAIVSTVETMIIADVPLLGVPVVKQLWESLLGWIAGYFSKAMQNGATFAVIDTQVNSEEKGVSSALAALIAAEKSGDKNAIQTAIKNYATENSSLIHSDGSSTAI